MKDINLCIAWINAIDYDSVVLKEISICNLLHHNTGNTAYVMKYPVYNMTFIHYQRQLEPIHQKNWHLRNI